MIRKSKPATRWPGTCWSWGYSGDHWRPFEACKINSVHVGRFDWAIATPLPAWMHATYGFPLRFGDRLYTVADFPQLPSFIAGHPGCYWQIGNEPDGCPYPGTSVLPASAYVDWAHSITTALRQMDPTVRLICAGLACNWPHEQIGYASEIVSLWRQRYGEPPFVAWDIHVYTNSDRIRQFRSWMNGAGLAGYELQVGEFGRLYDPNLSATVAWLDEVLAVCAEQGVERGYWFDGYQPGWPAEWQGTFLWDGGGSVKPLGIEFRSRVK